MSTTSQNDDPSSLRPSDLSRESELCHICCELFFRPKTLPCGHNFCTHCINRLVVHDHDGDEDFGEGGRKAIRCPLCRKECYLTEAIGLGINHQLTGLAIRAVPQGTECLEKRKGEYARFSDLLAFALGEILKAGHLMTIKDFDDALISWIVGELPTLGGRQWDNFPAEDRQAYNEFGMAESELSRHLTLADWLTNRLQTDSGFSIKFGTLAFPPVASGGGLLPSLEIEEQWLFRKPTTPEELASLVTAYADALGTQRIKCDHPSLDLINRTLMWTGQLLPQMPDVWRSAFSRVYEGNLSTAQRRIPTDAIRSLENAMNSCPSTSTQNASTRSGGVLLPPAFYDSNPFGFPRVAMTHVPSSRTRAPTLRSTGGAARTLAARRGGNRSAAIAVSSSDEQVNLFRFHDDE